MNSSATKMLFWQLLRRKSDERHIKEFGDWSGLTQLLERHEVFSFAARFLLSSAMKQAMPPTVATEWQNRLTAKRLRAAQLGAEWQRIISHCRAASIELIAYKGPALAAQYWPSSDCRESKDLDFFIRGNDGSLQNKLLPVLTQLGYRVDDLPRAPGPLYRWFQGEWCFYHPAKRIPLEIHWRATERAFFPQGLSSEQFWSESSQVKIFSEWVRYPSDELAVVLLALHAAKHRFAKIKWLLDLDLLLRQQPTLDWSVVAATAEAIGATRHLAHYLYFTKQALSTPVAIDAIECIAEQLPAVEIAQQIINGWHCELGDERDTCTGLGYQFSLLPTRQTRLAAKAILAVAITPRDIAWAPGNNEIAALVVRPFRLLLQALVASISRSTTTAIAEEILTGQHIFAELCRTRPRLTLGLFALYLLVAISEAALLVGFLPLLFGSQLPQYFDSYWFSAGSDALSLALMAGMSAALLATAHYWIRRASEAVLECYIANLRQRLIDGWAAAPWSVLAAIDPKSALHELSQEIDRTGYLAGLMLRSAQALIAICVISIAAALISLSLALITGVVAAVVYLLVIAKSGRFKQFGEQVQECSLDLFAKASEFFSGTKWLVASGRIGQFAALVSQASWRYAGQSVERTRASAQQEFFLTLSASGVLIVGVFVGATWLALDEVQLLAMFFIAARLYSRASDLVFSAVTMRSLLPSFKAVKLRLATMSRCQNDNPTVTEPPLTIEQFEVELLSVENVSFSYPGGAALFSALSFQLERGETVLLSGPSGAGKTTFVDLLLGLRQPTVGALRVNDLLLSESTLPVWRRQVAYLTQEVVLFAGTVRQNIIGHSGGIVPAGRLAAVLALTGVDRLVAALPQGLDTEIGPGSVLLSGGERQRLALARALLGQPRFIFLDEATNALDIESEAKIFATLLSGDFYPAGQRPAVVMVTHRPTVAEYFSRQYELVGGQLREMQQWQRSYGGRR